MPTVTQQLSTELEIVKRETAPIISRTETLEVTDPQSYAVADSLLTKIVTTRKTIKTRLSKILDPLKEALKQAQSLLSEVDTPLSEAESTIRGSMKDYKLEEAGQANLAARKREEEAAELRRQADLKKLAESKAKTQQMRDKLAAQRAELETKADVTEVAPAPALVKAAGSTTRTVKVPIVIDECAFIKAVASGLIPPDTLSFHMVNIKAHCKSRPDLVAKWPGLDIIDDIQIVHQSGRIDHL